jgi:hypothetical protein
MSDDFFAAPPFKADEALTGLRRSLRELGGLKERGAGPFEYEFAGKPVARIAAAGAWLDAALARQLSRSPDWQPHALKSSADVRRYVETLKRQLAKWADDD